MALDVCFIVKLIVCLKNKTTEHNCGSIVTFTEKCNRLVVETTVPGNLQSMAVSGSLSVWVLNRGGDMVLLSSSEWFNKPHFVTLGRTSPSGQSDGAGDLKPSLNNLQKKYCVVCNCTSSPKKLMSFISVAHRGSFFVCVQA